MTESWYLFDFLALKDIFLAGNEAMAARHMTSNREDFKAQVGVIFT